MTQLQQRAQQAVEGQRYTEAAPALAELERRLGGALEPALASAHEGVLYALGFAQLQTGQWTPAAATFGRFAELYPQSRQRAPACLYRGDAHYFGGDFPRAREAYELLRTAPALRADLDVGQELELWDRLSDCAFAANDWEIGMEVFREFQLAAARHPDATVRYERGVKATSYLLQATIAAERWEEALAMLPALTRHSGPARFELSLNLALLRAGDVRYQDGGYAEALYFYERVLRPETLRAFWADEVKRRESAAQQAERIGLGAARATAEYQLALARQRSEHLLRTLADETANYSPALQFRIARCYLARERPHEAYWAFRRVALEAGDADHGYAEETAYGAIKAAVNAGRPDRAREDAQAYWSRRDYTRFVGDVAQEWVDAERAGSNPDALRALPEMFVARVREQPTLLDAAKLIYLAGSLWVEQEDLTSLQAAFTAMAADFSTAAFADGPLYWLGLAAIFEGDFAAALARFQAVAQIGAHGPYAEDAFFRSGVCYFGQLEYERAQERLREFLQRFPHSRLSSEAHALLGDLAAADGRIDDALAAYEAAESAGAELTPPHLEYINHAIFQGGKLLAANGRWQAMADWFARYVDRWGAQGRVSEAVYEQGRALDALGRGTEAVEHWFAAIIRFGDDPKDAGPDLMLAEYPERYRRQHGAAPVEQLQQALIEARTTARTALSLRLAYALYALGVEAPGLQLELATFERASVAVLVQAARQTCERDPDFARQAAEAAVQRAPDSGFAEAAWHLLGALRHAQGESAAALDAYRQAATRFPSSRRSAEARLREGDLLLEQGDSAGAIAAHRSVLQTREWRGAPWAEANYKIGLVHFRNGELKEAFGFCQRVYVLYANVVEWAAPAYLQSGLVLEALGRAEDAASTYRELLAKDELRDTAAARAAAERLGRLP